MKKRIVWIGLSCLIALAVLLAACASPAKPGTPTIPAAPAAPSQPASPATPAAPATTAKPVSPATAATTVKPRYGGTINLVTPLFAYFDFYRYESVSLLVDSLFLEKVGVGNWTVDRKVFNFPSDQGGTPLEYMRGQLVEKWELPDPKTFIYHVRKNVHFHNKPPVNGREFTADDLVWNLQRIIKSPFTDHEYHQFVDSITKQDKYTVTIKLKEATNASTLGIIDPKSDWFIPPEIVNPATNEFTDWKLAIGTGAFMLSDYVADSTLTFKRNPDYWGFDEANPENKLPYADTVKVLIIADASTQLSALRTGKSDHSGFHQALFWQDARNLVATAPQVKSRGAPLITPRTFRMRVDKKPYDDVRVRQAVSMSIDRLEIAKSFFGGFATPYAGMVQTRDGDQYTPYEKLPDKPMWTKLSVKEVLSYSPEKAKQLLAEAGYPNGFKTQIDTSYPDDPGIAEILQSYLAKIGIQAEIKAYERAAFNSYRYGKQHPAMILHWNASHFDPLHRFLYYSDPNYLYNLAMVNDPLFAAKWKEATVTYDKTKLKELIQFMDYYSLEHAWSVVFPHPEGVLIWQPWLKPYAGEGPIGYYNAGALFARLWVDQDMKKSLGF